MLCLLSCCVSHSHSDIMSKMERMSAVQVQDRNITNCLNFDARIILNGDTAT